ncbi:hemagglutinin repeat-containing protein, partial [Thauera sinica]
MGEDGDTAWRRLGDGLYEQRLVQQAVVARTGQRFLAGLDSDEATYRYLMDNALASKAALNLSVGVSLTAGQVAALTHDIVWLETVEVNGERVLAPVLYLAQAEGRLGPTGALIQGQNLELIAGGTLANRGTLRATGDLSASATTVLNAGLMEAGERLSVLGGDSVANTRGGILAGRDVDVTALDGDLINERTVTHVDGTASRLTFTVGLADSAARIEALGSLSLSAGRDLYNLGGVISAIADLDLSAGRDLVIAAAEERDDSLLRTRRRTHRIESVTQYGGAVSAGGDLTAVAGQDLSVIGSRVEAGGDATLLAGNDLTLSSAADASHEDERDRRRGKKLHQETRTVRQQAAEVEAGGDLTLAAGQDLTLVASNASAGREAYLYAGRDVALLAQTDQDAFLYDKKSKGGFGSRRTRHDEVNVVTQVGSRIEAGTDLTVESGGDQRYQVAKLKSGQDLTLDSGGGIAFEGVKDLEQAIHEKSDSDWAWTSAKGKGKTDETLRQSELIAGGELAIRAAQHIRIDVPEVNAQTVSQTITALAEAE